MAHISSVSDLRAQVGIGNIVYLACFRHSWNETIGALLIGQEDAPDTNLTNAAGPNNVPVASLPAPGFRLDGQIRLFGCSGAYGTNSIAQQLAEYPHLPVYGFSNFGGSIGTMDPDLGHGARSATEADVNATIPGAAQDVWMVPSDGTPTFLKYEMHTTRRAISTFAFMVAAFRGQAAAPPGATGTTPDPAAIKRIVDGIELDSLRCR